ncbi:MAG: hypothetical protein ACT4OU_02635 [Hyphomicrobium sp.]
MVRDGLYKIVYPVSEQPLREFDEALAIVRRGRIFASDRHGGVYRGYGAAPAEGQACRVALTAEVPAGGELVTGFDGGGDGALTAIFGDLDPCARRQHAVIHVAGAPLEIDVSYLGPLPS